ncbi:hypothetical protein FHS29_004963 [Saccharothrix tamanrassetensis]|uniref:Uncharacterized protein n=1 Tax=Saccharothrix tamanrassetensis TaxID=1051531 RepID=A0A841CQT4_9PSEU|nr:hypothetical protein [Saccharothrix tamanrassetensis]MBB5958355.1 hypothetical protein [Saccharothrix tamanrassetensis]
MRGLAELRAAQRAKAGGAARARDRWDAPIVVVQRGSWQRKVWQRLFKRRVRRNLI